VDVTAALAAARSIHELQLWSAEQPSLYLLLVKLAGGGQLLEVEGCQVSSCYCPNTPIQASCALSRHVCLSVLAHHSSTMQLWAA
jgi:hypothetical protein